MSIRGPFSISARVADDSLWYLVYGTNVNQPRRGTKTGIRQQGHFDLDLLAKSSSDAPAPKLRFSLKREKGGAAPDRAAPPWLGGLRGAARLDVLLDEEVHVVVRAVLVDVLRMVVDGDPFVG